MHPAMGDKPSHQATTLSWLKFSPDITATPHKTQQQKKPITNFQQRRPSIFINIYKSQTRLRLHAHAHTHTHIHWCNPEDYLTTPLHFTGQLMISFSTMGRISPPVKCGRTVGVNVGEYPADDIGDALADSAGFWKKTWHLQSPTNICVCLVSIESHSLILIWASLCGAVMIIWGC